MRFRHWFESDLTERAHMAMWNDFKNFIARGNVIDLAVGMIIGAAFTTIVKSLVSDIIMPIVGLFTKGVDFSNLYINLSGEEYETLAAAQEAGAATVNYGLFINALVHFLIVAFVVFLMVKSITRLKEKAEDPADTTIKTPQDIMLLREIRDALVEKNTGK